MSPTHLRQRLDLVSVMITVVIAGVVGYVGINIMSNTESTAGVAANQPLHSAEQNLTSGLESFFSQLATVFVVIVLVVIVGYLMLLRGR